jgi:uncharacterized membrane protein
MVSWDPWVYQRNFALPRILIITSLILVLLMTRSAYAQSYTPDSLFVVLFSNGDALIEYDIRVQEPLADSITVQLFGSTIKDLIVTDFNDRVVATRAGASPNELVITPAGAPDIRISYSTPDLVSKDGRYWTFAINSPVSFSVKMPLESQSLEYAPIPTITRIGNQDLLTFRTGSTNVTYIVGFLGTREAADLAIRDVRTSLNVARTDNPGIILTAAQDLLTRAQDAFNAEQFVDAESLAKQASDRVVITVEDYESAIEARTEARARIAEAESQNRDTGGANALFEQSNQQFQAGNYAAAADSAEDAVRAIGEVRQSILPYGIGAVVAVGIAGAFYIIRKRQAPKQQATHVEQEPATASEPIHWPNSEPPAPSPPSVPNAPVPESVAKISGIPESQIDRDVLSGIVHRIIEERPHLRQEDRDVLVFLAQSEGAAFESEVRTKFQLPKTTVWRLVKRLEREELVEIRKAGGQNLIKLRFEGRKP